MKDSAWTNLAELPFNDKEFDNAHPSVSADGRRLYFTSNRTGGFGGMDLYVSTFIDGQWSEPVNLGPKINTDKNEIFPFIAPDGKLFFASNGHKGIGKLDIFTTMRTDTGWLVPLVLPEPINSRSDDFGLITTLNKRTGYFSSNRASGKGDDDIFSFESDQPIDIQRVIASDSELMAVETTEFSSETTASTTPAESVTTELTPNTPSVSTAENTLPVPSEMPSKTQVEPSRKESDKMDNDNFEEPKAEVVKVETPAETTSAAAKPHESVVPNVKPELPENESIVKPETREKERHNFEKEVLVVEKPVAEIVETPTASPTPTVQKNKDVETELAEKSDIVSNNPSEFGAVKNTESEKPNVEFVKNTSKPIEITAQPDPKVKPLASDSPRVASVSVGISPENLAEGTTREVENTNTTEKITESKSENTPSVSAAETKVEKPKSEGNLLKSSTLGKKYLVVVGTYATRANAAIQLKKAQTKGFDEAAIVHYEDKNLFAVCIKQFDKSAEAYGFAKNIPREKSLECFVKELK
ncbi:MAG: hypothetical protein HC817_00180 [Saprospiraceae bacterium]|nr:hypothetical protein [Saprospiraceae bacterium]